MTAESVHCEPNARHPCRTIEAAAKSKPHENPKRGDTYHDGQAIQGTELCPPIELEMALSLLESCALWKLVTGRVPRPRARLKVVRRPLGIKCTSCPSVLPSPGPTDAALIKFIWCLHSTGRIAREYSHLFCARPRTAQ
jgi:hypothetical protein